jgi:hypothetical protein|tara:strand:- start:140 stop:388 length:249 start_codon:yes stop_codon:yes gene_type:complete
MRARIGQITRVFNKTRRGNSNKHYLAVWAEDDGKPTALLITEQELNNLRERADKNRNDLPLLEIPIPRRRSLFSRFFRNSRR